MSKSQEQLEELVRALSALPREEEWLEFKENYSDLDGIGQYGSALANSAALHGKDRSYMVWGINDESHAVVGTSFRPKNQKVGNEDFLHWLTRGLEPQIHFEFFEFQVDGKFLVLWEITPAEHRPIAFKGVEYIRVGSYKKRLQSYPDHERRLWQVFQRTGFELGTAKADVPSAEVSTFIDVASYFQLLDVPIPADPADVLETLASDLLITKTTTGRWNITNMGAVLFARNLDDFGSLGRKALRIIHYRGTSRVETIREQAGQFGYAKGFGGAIDYLLSRLPSNEVIKVALRQIVRMFPDLAVRELLANALIHQDFSISGAGPMVEIFDDRLEISNPGEPLVDHWRFVDTPPRSRNERLAGFMRRAGICEERGSGWDKVAVQIEAFQLPAPLIEVVNDNTRVVLFGHRDLKDMDREDRVRATYLHTVLRWVNREKVTNASVRERFGISDSDISKASRIIKEALEDGRIAVRDPSASPRYRDYVPFWATAKTTDS
ncbi:ATP-binding protein [Micromonospora sp. DT41]|uniref:ATP-binding protein n=1 Tax=Micromonospora sp. DT41 TaxID=3393437 RepID=UPI003CEC7CBB